jgi:hypothetical protein
MHANTAPLVATLRRHAWRLRDAAQDHLRPREHRRAVFQRIYDRNLWGDPESVSGGGSGTAATAAVRLGLPVLFERYAIRSLVDAPCGDFHWMRHIVGSLERYVGVDIVPELIERNSQAYVTKTVSFACADISSEPIPGADAILCRDCFIHLPTRLIRLALANFRAPGARYLLLTNDLDAGPSHDIAIGSFRSINFLNAPFSFPAPLDAVSEAGESHRQLCLWQLNALDI